MRTVVLFALGLGCGFDAHGNSPPSEAGTPGIDTPIAVIDAPAVDAIDAYVPPPAATCGAPQALADDYTVTSDWALGAANGGSTNTSTPGQITLQTAGNGSSGAAAYAYHSASLLSAASTVWMQKTAGSGGGVTVFSLIEIDGVEANELQIYQYGSALLAQDVEANVAGSAATVPYDGSAMQYWRIAESAGTVAFETSPDGSAWTLPPILTVPTPAWVAYVHPTIDTSGSAVASTYANLDGSGAGSAMPWCDASTLRDQFGSDSLYSVWANSSKLAYSTNVSTGNACMYGSGTVSGAGCFFGTSARYDLVGSTLTIHWGSGAAVAAQPFVAFEALDSGHNPQTAQVIVNSATQVCAEWGTYPCANSYSFDPDGQDAYWQITEFPASSEIQVSSSPTGSAGSWSPILTDELPSWPLSAVEIRIGANAGNGAVQILGVN